MSWFGLGRRKVTRKELADLISEFTFGMLTDTVSNRFVPDATRADSPLDAPSIIRECYYLLQFGTSLALLQTKDPEGATEILQQVTDAMTVRLHDGGLWPMETAAQLSEEYFNRREEFVRTLEGLPDEEIKEGIEAVLAHSAVSVTGGRHLHLPEDLLPAGIQGALVALACGQFTSVTTILKRVRVTPS